MLNIATNQQLSWRQWPQHFAHVSESCRADRSISASPIARASVIKRRGDPDALSYMWGMASQLSDATIEALSTYYAEQAPSRAKTGDDKLMARGKQIFEEGVTAQGTPACATRHGPQARGQNFPRLAGEHADYLVKQALVIQRGLRASPVMHEVVKKIMAGGRHLPNLFFGNQASTPSSAAFERNTIQADTSVPLFWPA